MILEHLPALNQHRLLLASASPRRKEILHNLGLRVEASVVCSYQFADVLHVDRMPAATMVEF